jgi:secreted PhoX family phosphatase
MSVEETIETKLENHAIDRRVLLRRGAAIAAATTLPNFMTRQALALGPVPSPYGPVAPVADHNTGLALLQLPAGFEYWSFGWTGDPLNDGNTTPAMHDGMAVVFQNAGGRRCTLVRNHEVAAGPAFASGPLQYSPGAGGGNTNIVWNTQTKALEQAWASLSGTIRNCAGGVTPWKSWISCEETFSTTAGGTYRHGYCFDVPAHGGGQQVSKPIKAMGRFAHEAICVDPSTYYIYETEDGASVPGDLGSGFYRFIPHSRGRNPNLQKGGILQMVKIVGMPNKDMGPLTAPAAFATEWVTIGNPDPSGQPSCFMQGYALGGARFRRLEGCWFGLNKVYFTDTTGGPNTEGQVWEYDPAAEMLRLIYNSSAQADCENPDNLVVTPHGALILCEDNSGGTTNDAERLLCVNLAGDIFTFAKNNVDFTGSPYTRPESGMTFTGNNKQNEWAGACFDETGEWMFVNIQTPGITFAITGPWSNGPI